MKIHHLNCGTMCPLAVGNEMVCHVLLIETNQGLVLVDSGFGEADLAAHGKRLGAFFNTVVRPKLRAEETALAHLKALGFQRQDVRHIILTHMDLDHAGGLTDFPDATVHVYGDEHRAATAPKLSEKGRYVPAQWKDAKVRTYDLAGDKWEGFDAVRALDGLPPEILMVPVIGHTRGHAAIAISQGARWLVHAGDAFFHRGEIEAEPSCPTSLAVFQRLMAANHQLRIENLARLRDLAKKNAGRMDVFCAHDPEQLKRFA